MKCISLKCQTIDELYVDFAEAKQLADLVEIRLDHFEESVWQDLKALFSEARVLLSVGPKKATVDSYRRLASLGPHFLDIPHDMPHELFSELKGTVGLIASYHNYLETPEDLESIVQALTARPADLYKCVTFAHNGLDCLRMLWQVKQQKQFIGFCMGQEGIATRILAPKYGSAIEYLALDGKVTAPGQLSFGARVAGKDSAVYAIVGTPTVDHTYNEHDAVYVTLSLNQSMMARATSYFAELDFRQGCQGLL